MVAKQRGGRAEAAPWKAPETCLCRDLLSPRVEARAHGTGQTLRRITTDYIVHRITDGGCGAVGVAGLDTVRSGLRGPHHPPPAPAWSPASIRRRCGGSSSGARLTLGAQNQPLEALHLSNRHQVIREQREIGLGLDRRDLNEREKWLVKVVGSPGVSTGVATTRRYRIRIGLHVL